VRRGRGRVADRVRGTPLPRTPIPLPGERPPSRGPSWPTASGRCRPGWASGPATAEVLGGRPSKPMTSVCLLRRSAGCPRGGAPNSDAAGDRSGVPRIRLFSRAPARNSWPPDRRASAACWSWPAIRVRTDVNRHTNSGLGPSPPALARNVASVRRSRRSGKVQAERWRIATLGRSTSGQPGWMARSAMDAPSTSSSVAGRAAPACG
jgi:hypothetical protein